MIAAGTMVKRRERIGATKRRANRQQDSGDGRLALFVIVEGGDVLKARRAIVQSGEAHVEVMRCMPVPHSSQVRLIVELDEAALGETLLRITGSLQKGELGRVIKVRPH
ncbi:MAG TPA: hypothetical protein VEF92_03080 [Burkholderiales bacterium]|nr:hypothetical protein [Burkholderiales bacterium]